MTPDHSSSKDSAAEQPGASEGTGKLRRFAKSGADQIKAKRDQVEDAGGSGARAIEAGRKGIGITKVYVRRGWDAGQRGVDGVVSSATLEEYQQQIETVIEELLDVIAAQDAQIRALEVRAEALEARADSRSA